MNQGISWPFPELAFPFNSKTGSTVLISLPILHDFVRHHHLGLSYYQCSIYYSFTNYTFPWAPSTLSHVQDLLFCLQFTPFPIFFFFLIISRLYLLEVQAFNSCFWNCFTQFRTSTASDFHFLVSFPSSSREEYTPMWFVLCQNILFSILC